LLPLDKGGNLRTWHLMRYLAQRHETTFLSFADPESATQHVEGMREVAASVVTVPRRDPVKGSVRFYADAALHIVDPLPYAIGKYRSRAFRQRVKELLATHAFDVIVCDFLPPALSLPERLPCPVVLFTHNVEAEIWRRHVETKRSRLNRWLYSLQHQRMLRFEERTLRRFTGVLAVSAADVDTFGRLYPNALAEPVQVIPTGVDTTYFTAGDRDAPVGARSLVFTGSMDWLPNEDAMKYFCEAILPIIRAEEPTVSLSIVGRAPTAAVKALAAIPGVTVTGHVDDVRPYVRHAAAYVVPLRIGGGTRLKIFEAMAMEKAVVSTAVGAEGLPVVDGTHLVLADGAQAFATAVLGVLRNVEGRRAIETAARQLVVARYDWSAIAGTLEDALIRFSTPRSARRANRATPVTTIGPHISLGRESHGAPIEGLGGR